MNMKKITAFLKNLPRIYIFGGVAVVIVGIVGVHFLTRAAQTPEAAPYISHVKVSSVASLASQTGPLPVTGKVTSLNHASILAQSSGEVVSLPHSLGDSVGAGEMIAQLENSSQQAAVMQAQGAYDAAQATLARATGSTAANSTISSNQATQGAANARASAVTALQSMYAALDDAVHTKADTIFSNPRSHLPVLNVSIPDSQLAVTVENERSQLEDVLSQAKDLQNVSSNTDIDSTIASMTAQAQTVNTFITNLIAIANQAQPNPNVSAVQIAGYQASFSGARSEVVGGISGLTAAKSAYDAASSGAQTAANSATAGTNSDIAAAQASVKSALGSLNAAKAALEKTIIRSPISGSIVSLPINRGDYVGMNNPVADISNPHALQVETYVTADDAKTLAVGGKATIGDSIKGLIVSVAPALDPTTNKIKVVVAITGDQSTLTDGETETVSLNRTTQATTATTKNTTLSIPIAAVKVTPNGPIIFTVTMATSTPSSTATSTNNYVTSAHPITLGSILGDRVVVLTGLTPEMDIVADARGLTDGQTVVVDTQ